MRKQTMSIEGHKQLTCDTQLFTIETEYVEINKRIKMLLIENRNMINQLPKKQSNNFYSFSKTILT